VYTDCAARRQTCAAHGSSAVRLYADHDEKSALINDVGQGSGPTKGLNDTSSRVSTGQQYAVADRWGDWTAIWYLGQKAWFENPVSAPTAIPVTGSVVVPKAGRASVPVYGRAYPESAAYAAYPGVPVQAVVPLQYSILAGQRYALQDATVSTDYYRATTFAGTPPTDHVDIRGQDAYYQVSLGHRTAYVRAADVDVVPAG